MVRREIRSASALVRELRGFLRAHLPEVAEASSLGLSFQGRNPCRQLPSRSLEVLRGSDHRLRFGELLGFVAPLLAASVLAPQLGRRSVSLLDRRMAALAKPASVGGVALAGAVLLAISGILLRSGVALEARPSRRLPRSPPSGRLMWKGQCSTIIIWAAT